MPKHSSNMQDFTRMSPAAAPREALHVAWALACLVAAHSAAIIFSICGVNSIIALPLRIVSPGRTRAPIRWMTPWVVSSAWSPLKLPHTPSCCGCADIST